MGKSSRASARVALEALGQAARVALMPVTPPWSPARCKKKPSRRSPPASSARPNSLPGSAGRPEDDAVMVLTDAKLTVALCTQHCACVTRCVGLLPGASSMSRSRSRPSCAAGESSNPGLPWPASIRTPEKTGFSAMRRNGCWLPRWPFFSATASISPARTHRTPFFTTRCRGHFDAVVCAYHDQGLIPFKLVAFQTGVNVTLGLPIIRTSPDHGTALAPGRPRRGRSPQHARRRPTRLPPCAWQRACASLGGPPNPRMKIGRITLRDPAISDELIEKIDPDIERAINSIFLEPHTFVSVIIPAEVGQLRGGASSPLRRGEVPLGRHDRRRGSEALGNCPRNHARDPRP